MIVKGLCKQCKTPFEGYAAAKQMVYCPICRNLLLKPAGGLALKVGLIEGEENIPSNSDYLGQS